MAETGDGTQGLAKKSACVRSLIAPAPFLSSVAFWGAMRGWLHSHAFCPLIPLPPSPKTYPVSCPLLPQGKKEEFGRSDAPMGVPD
jgi:hypothetical protein